MLTYKATNCPDVDGGRIGISEGDFGSADDRWLTKMLSHGFVDERRYDVSLVSVIERWNVLTFAVIHQTH